jgi:hypothetical protein
MTTRHYRAHQRFIVQVALTVTSTQRTVRAQGSTLDLGIGGAACELDAPLRLGEQVQVVVTTDSGPRAVAGEVAWVGWAESSKVRMGLRFHSEAETELADLLDELGVLGAEVGT